MEWEESLFLKFSWNDIFENYEKMRTNFFFAKIFQLLFNCPFSFIDICMYTEILMKKSPNKCTLKAEQKYRQTENVLFCFLVYYLQHKKLQRHVVSKRAAGGGWGERAKAQEGEISMPAGAARRCGAFPGIQSWKPKKDIQGFP